MANRDRYSWWAVAAGVVAAFGVVNYVMIARAGLRTFFDAAEMYRRPGIPEGIAGCGVILAYLAGGPACIFLGWMARRDIRRHPGLRGELMAHIAVIWGWMATVVTRIFLIVTAAAVYIGLHAG
jgi:hypothetical protein